MERVDLDGVDIAVPAESSELLGVHETVDRLAALFPQRAELVKLRYFAGLSMEEAADVLGISKTAAERHWTFARVWLFRAINELRSGGEGQ